MVNVISTLKLSASLGIHFLFIFAPCISHYKTLCHALDNAIIHCHLSTLTTSNIACPLQQSSFIITYMATFAASSSASTTSLLKSIFFSDLGVEGVEEEDPGVEGAGGGQA